MKYKMRYRPTVGKKRSKKPVLYFQRVGLYPETGMIYRGRFMVPKGV